MAASPLTFFHAKRFSFCSRVKERTAETQGNDRMRVDPSGAAYPLGKPVGGALNALVRTREYPNLP